MIGQEFEGNSKTQGRLFSLGETRACLLSEKKEPKEWGKLKLKKKKGLKSKDKREGPNVICLLSAGYLS